MKKKILHYFIPHTETHQKAHLLSWKYLFIYLLLFVLLRTVIDVVNVYRPGVLGISSNISVSRIIEDTNKERQKAGLPSVSENTELDEAAMAKAKNMFAENYWAHFSPSGKDPWGFILASGYKFSYAGENLARNFYNSDDVVVAWMNSPSHRDNILNSHYQDIGVAVLDGVLNGQQTTLVVQMFGRNYDSAVPAPQADAGGTKSNLSPEVLQQPQTPLVAGSSSQAVAPTSKPLLDPYAVTRTSGIILLSFIFILLSLDFIILKKRGVFRLSSHHVAHLGLMTLGGASLLLSKVGEIL